MNSSISKRRIGAMTLIELMVVLAAITVLAALVLPGLMQPQPARALRIQCVNNLKQTGLAFRIWEGDNGDRYPMAVPGTNGGSMDFLTGPNEFRTFQLMSNDLCTPKVLLCPEDTDIERQTAATNFVFFCNSNISYLLGVDACESNWTTILSGDHNITDGTPLKNGLLALTTNRPARWTSEVHNKCGNLCMADGSVQEVSISGLQAQIAGTGLATNRLLMPILGP